jgi:hypothetical protein
MPPTVISTHYSNNSNSSVASTNSSSSQTMTAHHSNSSRFPMDLKMITERLKMRYYTHVYLFRADVMRLFNNCREQFGTDTEQHKCADQLQTYFEKKFADAGFTSAQH